MSLISSNTTIPNTHIAVDAFADATASRAADAVRGWKAATGVRVGHICVGIASAECCRGTAAVDAIVDRACSGEYCEQAE